MGYNINNDQPYFLTLSHLLYCIISRHVCFQTTCHSTICDVGETKDYDSRPLILVFRLIVAAPIPINAQQEGQCNYRVLMMKR